MQNGSQKPLLLFSNYCIHSKSLLTTIFKYSLNDLFNIQCIENQTNIPSGIDRVPALVHENKLLTDENLFVYIDNITTQLKSSKNKDIEPFTLKEMGNSISDSYGYLEEDKQMNHSFVHLMNGEEVNNEKICTPSDDNNGTVDTRKERASYDSLISQREMELKQYLK